MKPLSPTFYGNPDPYQTETTEELCARIDKEAHTAPREKEMSTPPLTDAEKMIVFSWANCAHGQAEAEFVAEFGSSGDEAADFNRLLDLVERAEAAYGRSFPRYSEVF